MKQPFCEAKAREAYEVIQRKAKSNAFIQGLTGLGGWPYTILADGATLFTHYCTMLQEICEIYAHPQIKAEAAGPVLKNLIPQIAGDLLVDKVVGSIPIVGVVPNIICARAMVWRVGILFAMLCSRGDGVDSDTVAQVISVMKEQSPQIFRTSFRKPEKKEFCRAIAAAHADSANCERRQEEGQSFANAAG